MITYEVNNLSIMKKEIRDLDKDIISTSIIIENLKNHLSDITYKRNKLRNSIIELQSKYAAYNPISFNAAYNLIDFVYDQIPHAFEKGCGKDTMQLYWREATGFIFDKSIIRNALMKAVDVGKFIILKNSDGYKIFHKV